MWAGRPRPAMIASRLPQPSGFRSPSSGLTIIQVSALRSYLPTQVSGLKFPLSDSPPFLSSHHSALASSGFKSQPSGLQYFSSQISGLSTPVSPPLRAMLDRSPVQFRFGCLFPQDATGQSSVAERAGTRKGNCRAGSPNPALVSVCSLYRPAGTRVSHPPLRFRAKRIAFDHLRLSAPSAFRFQVSAVRSQCSSLPPPPSRFNPQAPGTRACRLHL